MDIIIDQQELQEEETQTKMRAAEDSPWKDILTLYLKDFFDFCLPELSTQIDWDRGCISLEQELRKLTKQHLTGKRILDKLVQVFLKTGEEQPILIHLDVQGNPEMLFPERMFTYWYRGYDLYKRPLISCAILTDNNKNWRPNFHEVSFGGTKMRLDYLVVKLSDYKDRLLELENSSNLFATVILIQLAAIDAKDKSDQERLQIKLSSAKKLYRKGFTKEQVQKLFIFNDWLMNLPLVLEIEYNETILRIEEKQKMAYVSSMERYGIQKGLAQGLSQGLSEGLSKGMAIGREEGMQEGEAILLRKMLERKFGPLNEVYQQRIAKADAKTLLVWGMRLIDAKNINEVFAAH